MSTPAQNVIHAALAEFGREVESWQEDHREAMACYEFVDFLALGVQIFDAISRQDEQWRTRVFTGKVEYDAEVAKRFEDAYRLWLAACERVEAALRALEKRFGTIRHAEEFRSRRREAEGILMSDTEFFGDGLTELCDAAVEEYREGRTVESR